MKVQSRKCVERLAARSTSGSNGCLPGNRETRGVIKPRFLASCAPRGDPTRDAFCIRCAPECYLKFWNEQTLIGCKGEVEAQDSRRISPLCIPLYVGGGPPFAFDVFINFDKSKNGSHPLRSRRADSQVVGHVFPRRSSLDQRRHDRESNLDRVRQF